jgi:hypothetical protein
MHSFKIYLPALTIYHRWRKLKWPNRSGVEGPKKDFINPMTGGAGVLMGDRIRIREINCF